MRRVVVASGYFDPLHRGHVEYLERARELGTSLVVIVNSDEQAALKKGRAFMPARDRMRVVRALSCVDAVVESVDADRSVCRTLAALHADVFANGGDQQNDAIPEATVCREQGVELVDGLGGKVQSSSALVRAAAA